MPGLADEGIQQLTHMYQRLRKATTIPEATNTDFLTANVNTATLSQWARRVAMSLVNAYVRQHRWRLALATLSEMYDELPDGDEASAATSGVAGNSPAVQTWLQHDMAAVTRKNGRAPRRERR